MTTETQRVLDGSTLAGLIRATVTQFRAWFVASWLANTSRAIVNVLQVATETSILAGINRTVVRWIHCSFLYHWFTEKPDPDVVVIDFRESYTVGPVIALIDRLAPVVERTWQASLVSRLMERFWTFLEQEYIAESRTIRLLIAAFEPPKSIDENQRE